MTFIGMVLPAAVIAMFDLGDENRAFPILFAGSLLGSAVLLLCVPVSRGGESVIFSTITLRPTKGVSVSAVPISRHGTKAILRVLSKRRVRTRIFMKIPAGFGRLNLSDDRSFGLSEVRCVPSVGRHVDSDCRFDCISRCHSFMCVLLSRNRPEETKVTNCGQSGQGMKSTKESETSNRSVGTTGTNEVGNGEA